MGKLKGLYCIFLLLPCMMTYAMRWPCCVSFLLKEKKQNPDGAVKRRSLHQPLHDGGEELQTIPTVQRKENTQTPVLPRNNSDPTLVITSAVALSEEERDVSNGTPWSKAQVFSKYALLQNQESQTPIPRVETVQAGLDSVGILKVPSNSPIDLNWDRVDSVSSKNSLVDEIIHSSETFRHCESSESLHASIDQETQTERKRVSFR